MTAEVSAETAAAIREAVIATHKGELEELFREEEKAWAVSSYAAEIAAKARIKGNRLHSEARALHERCLNKVAELRKLGA